MKTVALLLLVLVSLQAKDLGHLQSIENIVKSSPKLASFIDTFQYKFVSWYLQAQDRAVDGSSLLRFENTLGTLWMNKKTCDICHTGFNMINGVLSNKYVVEIVEMFIV